MNKTLAQAIAYRIALATVALSVDSPEFDAKVRGLQELAQLEINRFPEVAAAPELLAGIAPFAELCESAGCEQMGEFEAVKLVISGSTMRAARAAWLNAKGQA